MLCACNKDAPEDVLTSDESLMLVNDIESLAVSAVTKSKLESKFKHHIEKLGATRSERNSRDTECQDPNSAISCSAPLSARYRMTYRGCAYDVTGTYQICYETDALGNPLDEYISIIDIDIRWMLVFNAECGDFFNELTQLFNSGDAEALDDFYDLRDAILEQEWQNLLIQNYFDSDEDLSLWCGTPAGNTLLVNYYKSTCYRRCHIQVEEGVVDFVNVRCGNGCCVKQTEYCANAETGELEYDSPTFEQTTECDNDAEPLPTGCLIVELCKQNCSPID